MGHQNDKLDPAFTMRRNLPRNTSNELELLGFKLEKKNIGIKKHTEKVRFFFRTIVHQTFSGYHVQIELDYRSPFLHLQFFPMIKQLNVSVSYIILLLVLMCSSII